MNTCGIKQYATCVYYELDIPPISSLTSEDCVTIEQTTQDLYEIVSQQAQNISTEGFQTGCLNNLPENFTIVDIIKAQRDKICELENKISTLESQNICEQSVQNCNLDLTGLVDECGEPVTTLGQLLQTLIQN